MDSDSEHLIEAALSQVKPMSILSKVGAVISIVLLITLCQVFVTNIETNFKLSGQISQIVVEHKMIPGSKWIVVTSIQYPTEDIQRLASQNGWSLVVVADQKTPVDWNLTNVHFLSVEKQKTMGRILHPGYTSPGRFANALPFNSYTRKNLGYLYAILSGAEWIYDTDDDNKPYGLGLDQFDYTHNVVGMRYVPVSQNISQKIFNPYQFYGFMNMWPRGFPLEYLQEHTNGDNRTIACRQMRTAAVQQGLVHHDPDVDAIFRLQYAKKESGLNAAFNSLAPPITLEAGTYSPWNSQNTLFHYRAFFTMFLPTSVAFRVTDIWRSYFAQKLLHLIGEEVAFYPVNAIQFRNAHNYLKDFAQEIDVYEKSGKIIEFLDNWKCSSSNTHECVIQLAEGFENNNFFGSEDTNLIKSWIKALLEAGYQFPPLTEKSTMMKNITEKYGKCRFANVDLGTSFYSSTSVESDDWEKGAVNNFGELITWCQRADKNFTASVPSPKMFKELYKTREGVSSKKNAVLVIINNYPWQQTIGLLQRLYSPFFKTVVFCGTWIPRHFAKEELPIQHPINFVNLTVSELYQGHFYNYCISKVRDLRLQNVTGYYFIGDDAIFNFWRPLPLDKPVHTFPPSDQHQGWYRPKTAAKAYSLLEGKLKDDELIHNAWLEFKERLQKTKPKITPESEIKGFTGKLVSDFFYLPSSFMNMFGGMSEAFAEAEIFVEIAMAKMFNSVNYTIAEYYPYLWTNRGQVYEFYNKTILGIHPLKMRHPTGDLNVRKRFCATVIKAHAEEIYS